MRALLLFAIGAILAQPAEARVRKKRKTAAVRLAPPRPEDDPRKRGSSPAFRRASVAFAEPADLSQLPEGPVPVRLVVKGYALGALKPGGPAPHAHLIVDNEPALEVADATGSWTLKGLPPGPHLLRVVLCRPWHEVVKAPKAFALVRFWVGPRLWGKAGKAAESVIWPQPRRPLLTYVLPLGHPPETLELHREEGGDAPQSGTSEASPGGNRPVLDFYFSNGKLGRRGDKVRIVLDRRELPLITDWKPHPLRRGHKGARRITIDLLNRKGLKVNNAVNRTDRVFNVPG